MGWRPALGENSGVFLAEAQYPCSSSTAVVSPTLHGVDGLKDDNEYVPACVDFALVVSSSSTSVAASKWIETCCPPSALASLASLWSTKGEIAFKRVNCRREEDEHDDAGQPFLGVCSWGLEESCNRSSQQKIGDISNYSLIMVMTVKLEMKSGPDAYWSE
ncbi:uncharacterized protein SCHCODRAFT_02641837 [Schizophyllum commune H4-8]|uniref:uncharacterized protein n=1 Tax=Schizophyllum commune (strain H4-8 / FGSC 9210) TaxID=578458 RepID=UPI00215E65AC|nr:uncharacterized protein SCHCODRAFT_02641837 [Schizophyllum commune H4-8]KAI5886471.1 hypothetical protein SCHCODRAFT_02641837 [Schizophyllum commune H4-8]